MKKAWLTGLGATALVALAVLLGRVSGSGAGEPQANPAKETATAMTADGKQYSKSGYDVTPLGREQVEQLARDLDPEVRRVLLDKGTERPFCGTFVDNKETGVYTCGLCSVPLFRSDAKFDSGTGWPSFFQPVDPDHVHSERDGSLGMVRTEIQCGRCRSHLGHVFADGPPPTGQRYCLNSAALQFHADGVELPPESRPIATETAYFAGGCFWGIEDRFQQVPGVIDAASGYMGGSAPDPTYKQVCSGKTGHAEAVRVTYDPATVSYRLLLEWFFKFHDPTQYNRQGVDIGSQYRSAIFASDSEQLEQARAYVDELKKSNRFGTRKVVTRAEPADAFYEAEEHHQDYHAKHGGACPIP